MRSLVFALSLMVLAGCASSPVPEAPVLAQGEEASGHCRRFEIVYRAKLSALPAGAPFRAWIPVPTSNAYQTIGPVKIELDWKGTIEHRYTKESRWGNRVLYLEGYSDVPEGTVTLRYQVERAERSQDLTTLPEGELGSSERSRSLAPTSRVVVSPQIKREAEAIAGADGSLLVAEGAYDHVAAQMIYDKTGVGWGQGDSHYACEVGKGNCTDYHAYFMALCMARGVPTQFEIGLFGPYESRPDEVYELGGYHCWAEFWAGDWVPVDISEGDKVGIRYLGRQTPNRVTLSRGRDLVLEPAQAGPPLNYFVDPYVEVAGAPHAGVSKQATWRDLP
ncbi:MAG: transglutaminase domain-containing protein [Planctomycetes bacterium]|nr:transglutaminase domain-containing protein [Planctomycetota bacterium]